jgi:hypothetical protein
LLGHFNAKVVREDTIKPTIRNESLHEISVVLYGCETWSLTIREEHRLGLFEKRVLWRIFGQKRDKVTVGWRKLHNEEFHNLYFSPNIIGMVKSRRMIWAGHVARMGRKGMRIGYWWESQKERD